MKHADEGGREAGADATDLGQPVAGRAAEQQGTEPPAVPIGVWQPAPNHKLLLAPVLDLQPVARPFPRLIDRIESFGDKALEPLRLAGCQQRAPVARVPARRLPV